MNWNVVFGLFVLFFFFVIPILLWIVFTYKKNKQYLDALRELGGHFDLTIVENVESYEWAHYRGFINGFKIKIGSYSDSSVIKGSGGICNKVSMQVRSEDDFEFVIVKRNIFQAVGESLDNTCVEINNSLLKRNFIFRSSDAKQLEPLLNAKCSQLIIDLWSNGNHLYYYLSYKKGLLAFSNSTNFKPEISIEKFSLAISLLSELAVQIKNKPVTSHQPSSFPRRRESIAFIKTLKN